MAVKSAGLVSIRVTPDTRGFRKKLKKALDRIENTVEAEIEVTGELSKTALRRIRAQLKHLSDEDFGATINADADTGKAEKDLDGLADKRKAPIEPDVDGAPTSTKLKWLTRLRRVAIKPEVKKRALAAVEATLARLSGARLLSDYGRRFKDFALDLDRIAPKLGLVVAGILSITSVAGAATSSLAAVGGTLAQIAPLALAIPGLFAGLAAGMGVSILAVKDFGKVLPDVIESYKGLQTVISDSFWARAAEPVRAMANTLLPTLNTGFQNIAQASGRWAASLAQAFVSTKNVAGIQSILQSTRESIDKAAAGTGAWVTALIELSAAGAAYLPKLAAAANEVGSRFADWVSSAVETGRFNQWVDTAVQQTKLLGGVLAQTGGIFSSLFEAASSAGATGLQGLYAGLSAINEALSSTEGQQALTAFFEATRAGVAALAPGLKTVGAGLATMMGSLEPVLVTAGGAISNIGVLLGGVLSNPAFQAGLSALVSGFQNFMGALVPLASPLASVLGTVGELAGTMLSAFGPVIASAVQLLAPIVTQLGESLQPLVTILGDGLQRALAALQPIVQPLVALISEYASSFAPVLQDMLNQLIGIIQQIAPLIGQVITAITPLIGEVLPEVITAINMILGVVQIVCAVIVPIVTAALSIISGVINAFMAVIQGDWQGAWDAIKTGFSGAWDAIIGAFPRISSAVSSGISAIVGFFAGLGGRILGAISGIGSTLFGAGQRIVSQLADGIRSMIGAVGDAIGAVVQKVRNFLPFSPAKEGPFAGSAWWDLGKPIGDQFARGIESRKHLVAAAAAGLVRSAVLAEPNLDSQNFIPGFAGAGSNITVNVQDVGDPIATGYAIVRHLARVGA